VKRVNEAPIGADSGGACPSSGISSHVSPDFARSRLSRARLQPSRHQRCSRSRRDEWQASPRVRTPIAAANGAGWRMLEAGRPDGPGYYPFGDGGVGPVVGPGIRCPYRHGAGLVAPSPGAAPVSPGLAGVHEGNGAAGAHVGAPASAAPAGGGVTTASPRPLCPVLRPARRLLTSARLPRPVSRGVTARQGAAAPCRPAA
jgi:hypothetical protein